ncbi:MAG: immunoglobulin domain-containing protein [Sedimentisphaerales bacterium]|nr:immunoglobulin domain-containing protein [Sedimentisphaerales bacterium]
MKKWSMTHRTWQRNLFLLLSLGAAVVFSVAGSVVRADSIAVDFGDGSVTAMAMTETAGVIPQANWNGSGTATSGTVTGLVNDLGAGTGASVTWTCNNTWRTPITEAAGDARMMKGYIDTNATSTTTVTVAGIPYRTYDLIVYMDGDNGTDNRVGRFQVVDPADNSVDAGPVFVLDPASTNFGGTYIQVPVSSTSDLGTSTPSGNYILFEELTLASFTLEATPGTTGSTKRAAINGIQLIQKTFPLMAGNPDPPDDPDLTGDQVPTNKTMSWTTAEDPNNGNYGAGPDPSVVGHYVYLTTDKAALEATPAGDTADSAIYRGYQTVGNETYTPGVYNADTNAGGLDTDKVYYWRIDERSDYGAGEDPNYWIGEIWTFQTTKLLPVFNPGGQPDNTAAFPGDAASLVVSVTSDTEEHYAWKKVDPDGGEDPNVGTDSATLAFDSVQVTDEGQYYCVITNDAGPVASNAAWLIVKRLVGRWELNNDLNDSKEGRTGGMYYADGTASTDPNFSDDGIEDLIGQDGQSFRFYGDGKHVRIADTAEDYNFYRLSGLTASAWVKTTQTDWGAPVSKQDREAYVGWILNVNNTSGVMTIRQAHNDIEGDTAVNDGEWHLVTGTYDPATGQADVYIDGQWENGWVDTAPLSVQTKPVVIGAETDDGQWPYTGLVDDVRVYNYPLSSFDIALLYISIRQSAVICAEPVTIDYNNDCIQDLLDFAIFARTWLLCNNVPTCWNTPEHPLD